MVSLFPRDRVGIGNKIRILKNQTLAQTNGHTDSPCILQDFVPFGAAAQRDNTSESSGYLKEQTAADMNVPYVAYCQEIFDERFIVFLQAACHDR